jgi:hypothetical protein
VNEGGERETEISVTRGDPARVIPEGFEIGVHHIIADALKMSVSCGSEVIPRAVPGKKGEGGWREGVGIEESKWTTEDLKMTKAAI